MPRPNIPVHSKTLSLPNLDFNLHYLEATAPQHPTNEAILLIHGWPTSSHLYRKMVAPLAEHHRVIAIDLPGFGQSDKDPTASFSFNYHTRILDAFCEALNLEKVHIVVHDLGGPIGLWWAFQQPERIASYVLLNTLVFREFSWAVKLFVSMTLVPGIRNWLSGPKGIRFAMRLGLVDKSKLTPESLAAYQAPFKTKAARKALLKSASRLHMNGFKTIAAEVAKITQPTCLIYGEADKILPDVAKTMSRVEALVPQATKHGIPHCGHFLQEEDPEAILKILHTFYAK